MNSSHHPTLSLIPEDQVKPSAPLQPFEDAAVLSLQITVESIDGTILPGLVENTHEKKVRLSPEKGSFRTQVTDEKYLNDTASAPIESLTRRSDCRLITSASSESTNEEVIPAEDILEAPDYFIPIYASIKHALDTYEALHPRAFADRLLSMQDILENGKIAWQPCIENIITEAKKPLPKTKSSRRFFCCAGKTPQPESHFKGLLSIIAKIPCNDLNEDYDQALNHAFYDVAPPYSLKYMNYCFSQVRASSPHTKKP